VHVRERGVARDLPRRLQPIGARHADVHQHHVGLVLTGDADGLGAVGRLRHHRQVLLRVEQRAETGPYQGLVVGQDHSNRHSTSPPVGNVATTR
jgi:hypothetical protein